jgi:predicted glycosyltransferase
VSLRILIAVTHLLGAGHLTRAAALARAFAARGHDVVLVSGGMPSAMVPVDGIRFVQLPPVRTAGVDFRALLNEEGRPVDEPRLSARRALLLDTLEAHAPQVVITELFPFGRRTLSDEFLALLEAARCLQPKPLIAASVRDILASPKPERVAQAHERLARFYNLVLVHGDPDLVPLDASWPVDASIRPLLRYTGYVDEGGPVPTAERRRGFVVSGGSSAASLPLYRAAVGAAHRFPDQPWRLLVGNGVPEGILSELRDAAPPHMAVERARRDFRALLGTAALSISQAGYNTAVDLLRSGVKAVLVPFEGGHETEQLLRAERLESCGIATLVKELDLTADRLAQAVTATMAAEPGPAPPVALDGARRSVATVEALCGAPSSAPRRFDWSPLDAALARLRDSGTEVGVWWRDDDAAAETPGLRRLLDLSRRYGASVGIAVIPRHLDPSLAAALANEPEAWALVHGLSHANHAPPHQKKAEFGAHRPLPALKRDAAEAIRIASAGLGAKLLPVFVPPWNRIAPDLRPALPELGYRGLSTFKDRPSSGSDPRLVEVNTHLDPVDWHGTRSLADPQHLIAILAAAVERRRTGAADPGEPVGLLTHHLAHDEAIWAFCDDLLGRFARNSVRFFSPDSLFSNSDRIVVEP